MREFQRPGAFDAAINLFTSLGYFDDPFDDLRVLRNFHASLVPGGTLLLDMMGREVIARIFKEREWRELPDGSLFLEERRAARNWTRIANRWLLIRPDGTRYESRHELRVFSAQELDALLREAGFTTVRLLGSYAGVPYDHNAARLVALASK
jgi:SAM-dependent methyltransferase